MGSELGFPGFKRVYKDNFFRYPNELEYYWHLLTGAEQKLLDFILRRTFGWQKTSDDISLSQFTDGVGGRGNGTGVSRAQVQRSLKKLVDLGFIRLEKRKYRTTTIHLVLRDVEVESEKSKTMDVPPVIAGLISQFKNVALHKTEAYLKDQKQVRAMGRLLEHYSAEDIERLIEVLPFTNGMQYAPSVTSPVEFEEKFAKLYAFIQKRKDSEERSWQVVL